MKDLAKIEEICHAALQLPSSQRAVFLQEACGKDDELRREVESLLSFEEQAKNFIEIPPQDIAAAVFSQNNQRDLLGAELNHYKILSLLGAGGMGEVFLAEDMKLGRQAALKLLPAEFSEDTERITRFEREARAVSALNHPNIITIYAIEETENLSFIATELVDGRTLRERISEKPLSPQETVEIGIQVAGALESAHAVGIIHRDIKPANIMIRRDGLVKVLDFGLAKLLEAEISETEIWRDAELEKFSASTISATASQIRRTNQSAVIGTLNYMSPEQALGLEIDARTDIFSLGVVLYEMLAGAPPFAGASDEDIYQATINKTPTPLRVAVNGKIPSELEKIVHRALTKDRDGRYQSISGLREDLQKLFQSSNKKNFHLILPIFVLLVAFSLVLYFFLAPGNAAPNPFQTIKLERLTAQGLTVASAISPDGRFLVYAKKEDARQSLWKRQTDTLTETRIVPAGQINYAFLSFSPGGESVYFVGTEKIGTAPALFQISIDGSDQRKLIEGVNSQIAFSPDGKNVAFVRDKDGADELTIADLQGGSERILAVRKHPEIYTEGVSWSPDGKSIAAATLKRRTNFGGGLSVVDAATGVEKPLELSEQVIRVSHLAWSKDGGGLLFCRYASPTGQRFQIQYADYPGGKIRNVTNDLTSYEDLSLTADGRTLLSTQREYSMGIWLTDENDFTKLTQIETKTGRDDGERGVSWTKDGEIIYVSSEGGAQNIWRMNADGTNQKPLTTGNERGKLYPSLNNDNGLITYASDYGKGASDFFQMDSDGQNVRQVTNYGAIDFYASANKDWIVSLRIIEGKKRIWKTPVAAGGEPVQLTDTESNFPALSPDGKFVAFVQTETNQPQKIAVISIDGGKPLKTFELPATADPTPGIRWTKDGSGILFVNTTGVTSNIWKQPLDGKLASAVTDFKEFQIASFALNSQGNRIAISRGSRNRDSVLVSVIP